MPVLVCYGYREGNGLVVECRCLGCIGHCLYRELERVRSEHGDAHTIMHAWVGECPVEVRYHPGTKVVP